MTRWNRSPTAACVWKGRSWLLGERVRRCVRGCVRACVGTWWWWRGTRSRKVSETLTTPNGGHDRHDRHNPDGRSAWNRPRRHALGDGRDQSKDEVEATRCFKLAALREVTALQDTVTATVTATARARARVTATVIATARARVMARARATVPATAMTRTPATAMATDAQPTPYPQVTIRDS
jgi:hypothetical protein